MNRMGSSGIKRAFAWLIAICLMAVYLSPISAETLVNLAEGHCSTALCYNYPDPCNAFDGYPAAGTGHSIHFAGWLGTPMLAVDFGKALLIQGRRRLSATGLANRRQRVEWSCKNHQLCCRNHVDI